jgi:peptidyl-prolyl cis-trans isomerase B (cyclophilin B)
MWISKENEMRAKNLVVVLAIFSSLMVAPQITANADSKKPSTANTAKKNEKIRCKVTSAVAQSPDRVSPPNAILKRFPKTITLQTNCGNVVIQTLARQAPVTVTVMATLARRGFFDDTLCHRLTTEGIYVLQCGDPTATGSGGPDFRYRDENLPVAGENNYPEGTVAMANSGPNTNGSQFFLVYKNTTLGPNYTIWGRIISGLDIVKYIADGGVKNGGVDGAPLRTISINKAITDN